MPKYSDEKLKGQIPIDPYQVRQQNYMMRLDDPVAKRIDAYVAPAKEATNVQVDPDAVAVSKALDNVNNSVGSWIKLQGIQKEENQKKALLDKMNGVYDKPTNILNVGVGYDETHAEAKMTDARLKAQAELKANNFFDGDQQKIQEVINKHYTSSGIDFQNYNQLTGASHQYQALQQYAIAGGEEAAFDRKRTQHYNDIGKIATNLLTEYRQVTNGQTDLPRLRQMFADLRHNMDTTLIPPEKQAEVAADAIMSATNQRVNDLIKEDRLDEAEEFKNDIISALRLPDKDGVVWTMLRNKEGINTIGDSVDRHESHFTDLIDKAERKIEAENQKTYKNNSSLYMSEMLLEKDSKKLQSYYATLKSAYDNNELDGEHYAHTVEFLNRVRQSDLNVIENATDVTAFLSNVFQGRAKISDVYQLVSDGKLRRDTAEKAIGMLERLKAHAESLSMQQDGFNKQLWWNSYEKGFSSLAMTFKKEADGNPTAWNSVVDTYNDMVFNKKLSPTDAKMEVIKKYTDKDGFPSFFTPYNSEAQAKSEYLKAKQNYQAGRITKTEFDAVARNAEVFMRKSSYIGSAPVEPVPPSKTKK